MYMVQIILIYMNRFLCNAHLNFGNSTHKFLHINQFMFNFFSSWGQSLNTIYALETHKKYKIRLH